MLSAYMRFKYPNVIDAALAASAPIYMVTFEGSEREFFFSAVTQVRTYMNSMYRSYTSWHSDPDAKYEAWEESKVLKLFLFAFPASCPLVLHFLSHDFLYWAYIVILVGFISVGNVLGKAFRILG